MRWANQRPSVPDKDRQTHKLIVGENVDQLRQLAKQLKLVSQRSDHAGQGSASALLDAIASAGPPHTTAHRLNWLKAHR